MIQTIPPPPENFNRSNVIAWVVGIIVFLLGAGGIAKIYLGRVGFFNKREEESWKRIKERLDEQQEVVGKQQDRLDRQSAKIDDQYKIIDQLHRDHFDEIKKIEKTHMDDRFALNATIVQLQNGMHTEKEANQTIRNLFESMRVKFEECEESKKEQIEEMKVMNLKIVACEERDRAYQLVMREMRDEISQLKKRLDGD